MAYDPPGRADDLSAELRSRWNETVQSAYAQQGDWTSRFFTLDPDELANAAPAVVKWFGDPAEPAFCIDQETARTLSDWGVRGRHELHNEYCEYAVVHAEDGNGGRRPKRVQVTTELREYWACVARADPDVVRDMAARTLGSEPSWEDLYGVADPAALDEDAREVAFSKTVAGNGGQDHLIQAGVPTQPTGSLNTDNALFMTHPINGLDDLIYIVMFGAHPYAVREDGGGRRAATREEIFVAHGVQELACRHADPAAAIGAHEAALAGAAVAFADPLGMYLIGLSTDVLLVDGEPVPEEWVRWGRGDEGMRQRLEFGPGDDDDRFLDDITVAVGAEEVPLSGGFQLLQQMEIGPLIVAAGGDPVADDEYRYLDVADSTIVCREAAICGRIGALKADYDRDHGG